MKLIHFITLDLQPIMRLIRQNLMHKLGIISLLLCASLNVQAAIEYQSLAEIRQTAKIFLEEKQPSADNPNIEIDIGKIDPRVRLVKCDAQLEAFFPQTARNKGKTTVGVRCLGSVSWKLFISANIQEYQNVWVAQRNISTSEIISAKDVMQKKMLVSGMRKTPIDNLKLIINTSPRRSIRSGSVIFNDSVCLVCRGEKVSVTAHNQFISIQVDGVALADASLGETTQVRNSKSKRIFGATVTGKSQLKVHISGTN